VSASSLDHDSTADPSEERWFLNDEKDFLLRSLHDADVEHEAGDLSDEDHAVLTERDRQRLGEVETALAALGPDDTPSPAPTRRAHADVAPSASEWRRVAAIAVCFLAVATAVLLVDRVVQPRVAGQASSGSITLSKAQLIEQQLAQATSLNNKNLVIPALNLYEKVLSEDPNDPEALADSGWLDWNYGTRGDSPTLVQQGRRRINKAIAVAPAYYESHLFLGLILLNQDHNATGAVEQFNEFLLDNPPAVQVEEVASVVRGAYTLAGVTVPPAFAAPAG
jgi:tetratricopeptide (TPR) repeat protein